MIDERTDRVADVVRRLNTDWAVLCSPELVCYATGHEVPIETGPSPHSGGPAVAIVGVDGSVALLVEELQENDARASRADHVAIVRGFAPTPHKPSLEAMHGAALSALLEELGIRRATVAVEQASISAAIVATLATHDVRPIDATAELRDARATKTARELEQLRACAELTAVGQRAAVEAAEPGLSELELFERIRLAMGLAIGLPVTLAADLLTGADRTGSAMGGPTERVIVQGESVICDLVPRLGGYWGDSCNTFTVGDSTPPALAALRDAAVAALECAAEVIRPGITAGELDAEMRKIIDRVGPNQLHLGHAIGTSNFEHPRVVPGEDTPLRPEMVLMIEPGVYVPGRGGARLEWMFRVTESGNELMSPFQHVATTGVAVAPA
jgi:Xaa-Pro aminopeptidase